MYNYIIVEKRDKIFKITFNRPEKKNAVNDEMYFEIIRAMKEAVDDKDTLLTVFTGKGDFYSSGTDLTSHDYASEEYARHADQRTRKFVACFIDHPKPLVALVNGPAMGIAATVLGMFDLVYASDKASFVTPFTSLGLSPEGCSSYTFPKIMGPNTAAEMLLFGKKLTAEEAHRRGFVSEVFISDTFVEETNKKLKRLANLPPGLVNVHLLTSLTPVAFTIHRWNPPLVLTHFPSVKLSKKLIRDVDRDQLHKVNQAECDILLTRWENEEFIEAITKFFTSKSKI